MNVAREMFESLLAHRMGMYPTERKGQAAWNLASVLEIRHSVSAGSVNDPFYRDDRIDAFLDKIFPEGGQPPEFVAWPMEEA